MQIILLATKFKLWPLGYLWLIKLKNKILSLTFSKIIPIQPLYNRISDLRYLQVFRYIAYIHISQEKQIKSA